MNNIKKGRISSQVGREIANILLLEAKDETLKHITVTGCDVTNDLSLARVYYTYMGDEDLNDVKKNLIDASPYIRTILADRLDYLRKIPELRFMYDTSIEYGEKIEAKIREINEKDANNE